MFACPLIFLCRALPPVPLAALLVVRDISAPAIDAGADEWQKHQSLQLTDPVPMAQAMGAVAAQPL